jgi:hypothetical protein
VCRRQKTGNNTHHGRLAGAVRPEEPETFSLPDREIDAINCPEAAKIFDESLCDDNVHNELRLEEWRREWICIPGEVLQSRDLCSG